MREINHIDIHHSGSDNDTVEGIRNYHTNTLDWGAIAYNELVDRDGVLQLGKPDDEYPFSTNSYERDKDGWAICVLGDFRRREPTAAQRSTLVRRLRERAAEFGTKDIEGHRWRFNNSECPGWSRAYMDQLLADVFAQAPQPQPQEDELKILPRPQQTGPKEFVIVEADTRDSTGNYWVIVCAKPGVPADQLPFDVGVKFGDGKIHHVGVIDRPLGGLSWPIPEEYVGPLVVFSGNPKADNNFLVDISYKP